MTQTSEARWSDIAFDIWLTIKDRPGSATVATVIALIWLIGAVSPKGNKPKETDEEAIRRDYYERALEELESKKDMIELLEHVTAELDGFRAEVKALSKDTQGAQAEEGHDDKN